MLRDAQRLADRLPGQYRRLDAAYTHITPAWPVLSRTQTASERSCARTTSVPGVPNRIFSTEDWNMPYILILYYEARLRTVPAVSTLCESTQDKIPDTGPPTLSWMTCGIARGLPSAVRPATAIWLHPCSTSSTAPIPCGWREL